jgi:hypothetical protein
MRTIMVGCLTAITLATAACHTLRPITLAELNAAKPGAVWVTRADQSVVVVEGPQLLGDTLVGYVEGKFEEMPTANLQKFVMKKPDKGKTTALIIGTTVGVAGVAFLLTSTGLFSDPQSMLDCDDDPDQAGCM